MELRMRGWVHCDLKERNKHIAQNGFKWCQYAHLLVHVIQSRQLHKALCVKNRWSQLPKHLVFQLNNIQNTATHQKKDKSHSTTKLEKVLRFSWLKNFRVQLESNSISFLQPHKGMLLVFPYATSSQCNNSCLPKCKDPLCKRMYLNKPHNILTIQLIVDNPACQLIPLTLLSPIDGNPVLCHLHQVHPISYSQTFTYYSCSSWNMIFKSWRI